MKIKPAAIYSYLLFNDMYVFKKLRKDENFLERYLVILVSRITASLQI